MSLTRAFATVIARAGAACLPAHLAEWGLAMCREVEAAAEAEVFGFALGCLTGSVAAALRHDLNALAHAFAALFQPGPTPEDLTMTPAPTHRLATLCAVVAVGLGVVYLTMAGAPPRYSLVNIIALVLGLATTLFVARVGSRLEDRGGAVVLIGLGCLLAATALWGERPEGAARWLALGGVAIQPSLIVLPAMILLFARTPNWTGAIAMAIAAAALAFQPDRAMSAILVAGLAVLSVGAGRPATWVALAAAAAGAVWAFAQPDLLPATPFVDRVFLTAFQLHPAAGLAVWAGALVLLAPGLWVAFRRPAERMQGVVFTTVWLSVIVAAMLGDYPTPLVAYGGSAILGYLLSSAGMAGSRAFRSSEATRSPSTSIDSLRRVAA